MHVFIHLTNVYRGVDFEFPVRERIESEVRGQKSRLKKGWKQTSAFTAVLYLEKGK